MRLTQALQDLTARNFIVKFEQHPMDKALLTITLSKNGYSQRGVLKLVTEEHICGVLKEASVRLDLYLKVRS